jgi:hypothetical protein
MSCRAAVLGALAAAMVTLPRAAAAQGSYSVPSQYDQLYGPPIDVSITDLAQNPEAYFERAVRTRGRLEVLPGIRNAYAMRDSFGATVRIIPVEEVRGHFETEGMGMMGRDVDITGVVKEAGDAANAGMTDTGPTRVVILFWSYQGPPEKVSADVLKKAVPVTLETLVTSPGQRDGQLVRVVGKFRGHNLYGDLPSKSQRERGDWVIKDEAFAVWITGRKPKGKGFDLDSSLKRDTGKWIEVIGKPASRMGVTWIQAVQINLTGPPTATSQALPPPPPPERPKVPPVIVFALPLDGDGEVAADGRFIVQFSKDMEEGSFKNRVILRYAGPMRPGDQPITNMRYTYDGGRRALIVDPGMMLAEGRQLELLLFPGIVDSEGLSLVPRVTPGIGTPMADGPIDILRYSTGS